MKAIETYVIGPTNTKGARMVARDGDGNKVTIPYPYEVDTGAAHVVAAKALCEKMKWRGDFTSGYFKARGYHCFLRSEI